MTLVIALKPLIHGLPPCFCVKGPNTGSCKCQQCAIVLGRTRGEVAFCSADGTCIVHSSALERMWLGQRQHQVMLGAGKPWGHLRGVHWNRQSCLWALQLLAANISWKGSQECAQLPWHLLCRSRSNEENRIPAISHHPIASGNLHCRASSLSPCLQ